METAFEGPMLSEAEDLLLLFPSGIHGSVLIASEMRTPAAAHNAMIHCHIYCKSLEVFTP